MAPLDAIYHENINEKEVLGAGLAGGVSGAGGAVLLPLVPTAVAASPLTGSAATVTTVGGTALGGGIINTASDFIGRQFETFLGSSRADDMYDLSTYTGSFVFGGLTAGGASAIDELLAPLISRSQAGAQAKFVSQYIDDAHIELWDARMAAGEIGWPPSEDFFELTVKALAGPPKSAIDSVPATGFTRFAGAISEATSVLFNADTWKGIWESN